MNNMGECISFYDTKEECLESVLVSSECPFNFSSDYCNFDMCEKCVEEFWNNNMQI